MDLFLTPSYIFVFGTHVRSEITVTDRASISYVYVFTVRQGWPQHRVDIWCCCPGGCRGSLGQKRDSLIASPSPCHTCSNSSSSARCRGVSPSSSHCRPSRSYLHALLSDIGPNDTTRTRMFHCRACDCEVTTEPLRATRKNTFSDGTAPTTSPSLRRHVAKSPIRRPVMPRSFVILQRHRNGQ